jgi:6-phosphofructokinase 1
MGRDAGWIALYSGLSSGSDIIILPEKKFSLKNDMIDVLKKRVENGHVFHMIALSEGAQIDDESKKYFDEKNKETGIIVNKWDEALKNAKKDAFGHPSLTGISAIIKSRLEKTDELKTFFKEKGMNFEVRDVVLGHLQRSGTPTAFDRVVGMRFGLKAMKCIEEGKFGLLMSLQNSEIVTVPVSEGAKKKYVTEESDLVELKTLMVKTKASTQNKKEFYGKSIEN